MKLNYQVKRIESGVRNLSRKFTKLKSSNLTCDQKMAISIVKKSIVNDTATLLVASLSHRKFIHLNDMFIAINDSIVEIANSKYSYEIELPFKEMCDINKCFNRTLERTVRSWESNINNKRARSLSEILQNLS